MKYVPNIRSFHSSALLAREYSPNAKHSYSSPWHVNPYYMREVQATNWCAGWEAGVGTMRGQVLDLPLDV
jgi:hypothetical protein